MTRAAIIRSKLLLLCLIAAISTAHAEISDSLADHRLQEVVVTGTAARARIANSQIGAERLELHTLAATPAFAGEADILKSIALLPGVRAEGDGAGGFEVRGGTAAQNRVMLDGATLFSPTHVMGIFSTFNDRAINRATLFKGPIPAAYGGASSSVLETALAPGGMERWHASGTVGILAAKIAADGPIVADRLSLAVTARRSYVDAFLKMVPKYRSTVMNFYDVTAKLRFTPSSRHTLDASFFISHDNMAVGSIMGMYWGNIAGSVNWLARAGNRLSFATTAAFTSYNPKMAMDVMDMNQEMKGLVNTGSINERITFELSDLHTFEAGVRSELVRVKSAEWTVGITHERDVRSLWENAAWIGYNGQMPDHWEVAAGLRLDVAGRKPYVDLQPRVSVKYSINELHSLKAGGGVSTQTIHSIRSGTTSFPFDRYALTSSAVRPERSVQYAAGYAGMTSDAAFDWSAEAYWKTMSNVYDYRDGCNTFSDIDIERIILGGRGRSYGAELMLRKNSGRLTGWISYTISRTQTRIPGINDGKWYDATNDRRHDITVTAIYSLGSAWNLSASWIYLSGHPLTAPDVKYEVSGITCYYYSRRNSYHTPPTHRLDLAATYTHTGRRATYQWSFGVFNAYCRYNPYLVYFENDPSKPSGTRAVQQSLYGLIPSVSYTLSF